MALFPERQRLLEDRNYTQSVAQRLGSHRQQGSSRWWPGNWVLWKVLHSPLGIFHIQTFPSAAPASRTGAHGWPLQPLQCRRTRQYCPQTPAPQAEMTYHPGLQPQKSRFPPCSPRSRPWWARSYPRDTTSLESQLNAAHVTESLWPAVNQREAGLCWWTPSV